MTPLRSRLPVLAAVAAAVVVGLTACSGGALRRLRTPPPRPRTRRRRRREVGTILSANSTAQLGTVVVDGQGFTLYRFDKDSAKPPTSNCAGECAQKWPPVLATPGTPLTVEGVAQEAVGTINRSDGTIQLTLNGWPVYRYSGDPQPGATTGQGVGGGEWAAVTPEGTKAAPPTTLSPRAAPPSARQDGRPGRRLGVWWPPRSSKPTWPRISVRRVRFPSASASFGSRGSAAAGRRCPSAVSAVHTAASSRCAVARHSRSPSDRPLPRRHSRAAASASAVTTGSTIRS